MAPRDTSDAESMLAAIKPIQDLARNWDINIASCLEDYLTDLVEGGVTIAEEDLTTTTTTDGGGTGSLEWAKAALVLHNSSHVYSRKVEYLYKLVLSAFERMSKQNSDTKNNRRRRTGDDDDVEEFFEFDPHQSFLLLDDVLPIDTTPDSRHINLPTSPEELELTRRLSLNTTMLGQTPNNRTSLHHQQQSATHLLGSSHNSSSNGAAAWLGAAIVNSNSGGGATSGALRLMNGVCELDETGRLILPGSQVRTIPRETDAVVEQSGQQEWPVTDDGGMDDHDDDGGMMMYGGDDDDDHDDGPGFVDENKPINEPTNEQVAAHASRTTKESNRKVHFATDKPDPWALLDPHEPTKSCASSKPLRLGKTIKLPERLRKKGSSNSKQNHNMPDKDEARLFTIEAFRHFSDPENFPELYIPMKGLVYGKEFASIARKEQAKRNAAKRREREQYMETDDDEEENDPINYPTQADEDEDDDGYLGGPMDDWGGDDDDDGYPDQNGANGGTIETNTGLTSVDQIYRDDRDENDSSGEQTFEELCRAHIARFARGAEKYAASTNLTKRVDQWQERLEPLLLEEEQRPVFDIFSYSQDVVDSLGTVADDENADQKQGRVNFARVAEGRTRYDVCRLFLASLSLCNSGNVTLHQAKGSTSGDAALEMQLISSSIERPMETYLAPSADDDAMAL